jgi:hypothetical protein
VPRQRLKLVLTVSTLAPLAAAISYVVRRRDKPVASIAAQI